jgi:hypothetical protein
VRRQVTIVHIQAGLAAQPLQNGAPAVRRQRDERRAGLAVAVQERLVGAPLDAMREATREHRGGV